jgi:LuxR family maltose regulon positive regulatory protein
VREVPELASDDSRAAGAARFEAKLHPPAARAAFVRRTELVNRLEAARDVPIVSVVAPPGYGKTTLLAQWAERRGPRVAWLSIDERDNDPEILLAYAAAALDRVEPIDAELMRGPMVGGGSVAATSVRRLASSMSAMSEPVTLVLDHVELLRNDDCRDAVAELALHLPARAQLAMATRAAPPVPTARLRAGRQIVEIGVDDLAMSRDEARALLSGAGIDLDDASAAQLLERTEGWPVGLYLGALSLQAGGTADRAGMAFSGDDRLMADYLRSEILARLSDDEVSFMIRAAVLDRMSGALCDAVLDRRGSAEMLESLERSNALLVGLDRRREWYRYHHLFRDLLRTELERREPTLVPELHRRAARWCEAHGMPEGAIDHARAGRDTARAARLVGALAQPAFANGRVDTVLGWINWLETTSRVDHYPAVAAYASLIFSQLGRAVDAERWAAASERAPSDDVLDDGSTVGGLQAYLRVFQCRDGIEQMQRDVHAAAVGLSARSPLRASLLAADGLALVCNGDCVDAGPVLAHAFETASHEGASAAAAFALAEGAVVAAQGNEWGDAEDLATRAVELVEGQHLEVYATSALAYTGVARVASHRGQVERAREFAARAVALRPKLTYAIPHVSVQTLLELARVYVGLADAAGARAVLRQARDILQHRPDLGLLPKEHVELQTKLDTMRSGTVGASSLTTAELRLVPLLSTHLTFPEIGTRLHVSRHTVKTQAISIYQKLGVSSRSEAIERMQEIGLLSA